MGKSKHHSMRSHVAKMKRNKKSKARYKKKSLARAVSPSRSITSEDGNVDQEHERQRDKSLKLLANGKVTPSQPISSEDGSRIANGGNENVDVAHETNKLWNQVMLQKGKVSSLLQNCRMSSDKNMLSAVLDLFHKSLGCDCDKRCMMNNTPFSEHFGVRTNTIVENARREYQKIKLIDHEVGIGVLQKRAEKRFLRQFKLAMVEPINLRGIDHLSFPVCIKYHYHQLLEESFTSYEIYIKLITAMRLMCSSEAIANETSHSEIESVAQVNVKELFVFDLVLMEEKIANLKPETTPSSKATNFILKECELQALLRLYSVSDGDGTEEPLTDQRIIYEIVWLLNRIQFYDVSCHKDRCNNFVWNILFDQFMVEEQYNVVRRFHLAVLFEEINLDMPIELQNYASP